MKGSPAFLANSRHVCSFTPGMFPWEAWPCADIPGFTPVLPSVGPAEIHCPIFFPPRSIPQADEFDVLVLLTDMERRESSTSQRLDSGLIPNLFSFSFPQENLLTRRSF